MSKQTIAAVEVPFSLTIIASRHWEDLNYQEDLELGIKVKNALAEERPDFVFLEDSENDLYKNLLAGYARSIGAFVLPLENSMIRTMLHNAVTKGGELLLSKIVRESDGHSSDLGSFTIMDLLVPGRSYFYPSDIVYAMREEAWVASIAGAQKHQAQAMLLSYLDDDSELVRKDRVSKIQHNFQHELLKKIFLEHKSSLDSSYVVQNQNTKKMVAVVGSGHVDDASSVFVKLLRSRGIEPKIVVLA